MPTVVEPRSSSGDSGSAISEVDEALRRLEKSGFKTEISWRLSRLGDEWLAQSRMYFGNSSFPNEAEVQFLAATKTGPYTVSIEAEVYTRGNGENETVQAASNAIRAVWPEVASEIVSAFERQQNTSIGFWNITNEGIRDGGYIIRLEGRLLSD